MPTVTTMTKYNTETLLLTGGTGPQREAIRAHTRTLSKGPRALVGHDTVCCTRDNEDSEGFPDSRLPLAHSVCDTAIRRGYITSGLNVETIPLTAVIPKTVVCL